MAKTAKDFDAEAQADPVMEEIVTVRITKMGAGKVSNGEHVGGFGDMLYDVDERPTMPRSTAEALEARGYAEIQEAPAAPNKTAPA